MADSKHILAAIDFETCSAAALQQAMRLGALRRLPVLALNVVEIPIYSLPEGGLAPVVYPPLDLLLSSARERWVNWESRNASVKFEAVLGSPRGELVARARPETAEMLVVGAHGEDVKVSSGVGPVAAACIQRSPVPVLVVREGQASAFRSVVACVDLSDTSRVVLDAALRLAALDGAALHVVHVYSNPWHKVKPPAEIREHMPDIERKLQEAVDMHLLSWCSDKSHELGAVKAQLSAVRQDGGNHGRGIVEYVKSTHSDLVVLGTRSKWNVRDFVWGSTAERVVREAPCAVLAVKPPGAVT
jgi:universal stress protein E